MYSLPVELNTTIVPVNPHPSKLSTCRNVENYILVWLDCNINKLKDYYRNSIVDLQNIINSIYMFKDIDQCVDFLIDVENEKVFMIISSSLAQQIIPIIQNVSQIDPIRRNFPSLIIIRRCILTLKIQLYFIVFQLEIHQFNLKYIIRNL
jgi:hypothetical protein